MSLFRVSVTHPAPRSFLSKLGVSVTLFAAAGAFLSLTGCKEGDADRIGDAQACLDQYSQTGGGDLAVCEAYVANLTTPAAHGIRCSTGYIREGFLSAQSFISAFAAIGTINSSTVVDFLLLLAFDSVPVGSAVGVNANYNAARSVNSSCSLSFAKGATLISTFSYLTNVLFKFSCDGGVPAGVPFNGNCNQNRSAVEGALAYGFLDAPVSAGRNAMRFDLGTIVVNANTVSCTSGATNEKLCQFLQTAITNAGGPNNKEQVGKEFLNVLAFPPP